ncbi:MULTISPECIES: hypothetical protein [Lysobacter]|uniref:hypothetical protein n=1 Tax=Lysobacter TaxID=68 RepID=UPI001F423CA8|nr:MULTISPECIES: hypothetical protein [Lysobacter]UJB20627.1 hypothetical protein L1A79_06010 [Lysobacter capsici]UJQ30259.1 hypothetical protein L2D09_08850 [Lysobacter gummosus]
MPRRWTSWIVASIAMFALTAARYPTELDRPVLAGVASFSFSDRRPPVQLESAFESKFITKCSFYAIRIGGQDIAPEPASVVRSALVERFADKLAGRSVELADFVVHLNTAAGYRAMQGRLVTGYLADKLNDQDKTGCADDDTLGSYRMSEIGSRKAPIIVVINLRIDGRPFHARAIAAYEATGSGQGLVMPPGKKARDDERALWNRTVSAVVAQALARLGDAIDTGLFGAPAAPAPAQPAVLTPTPVESPAGF